jgi:hypothetical protein
MIWNKVIVVEYQTRVYVQSSELGPLPSPPTPQASHKQITNLTPSQAPIFQQYVLVGVWKKCKPTSNQVVRQAAILTLAGEVSQPQPGLPLVPATRVKFLKES